MSSQVQCPHCGMFKIQTLDTQIIVRDSHVLKRVAEEDSRRVLIVFFLTLTIVGLPMAYVLTKRFEREECKRAEPICQYAYRCRLCNYAWTWRTDESLPRYASEDAPVLRRHVVRTSHLNELVAWWFKP